MKVRSLWKHHRVAVISVAAVVLLLGSALGWLTLGYGGAPPEKTEGVTEWRSQVERWQLRQGGELLCDHRELCEVATLEAASGDCAWRGRVWLSGHDNSFFLRSLAATGFAVTQRVDGTSTLEFEPDLGDTWWRAAGKHTDVELAVRCDTTEIRLSFNYEGKSLTGNRHQSAEIAGIHLTTF